MKIEIKTTKKKLIITIPINGREIEVKSESETPTIQENKPVEPSIDIGTSA